MERDRFVVVGVTGYSMGARKATGALATSYSVLDTAWNYREVARFYAKHGVRSDRQKARAEAECARLNAECGE